jgi:hypothetical protein
VYGVLSCKCGVPKSEILAFAGGGSTILDDVNVFSGNVENLVVEIVFGHPCVGDDEGFGRSVRFRE